MSKIDPKVTKLIKYKKDSAFATFESINEASDKLDSLQKTQDESNKIIQEIVSREIPAPIVNVPAPIVNVPETVVNIPAPVVNVPAPIVNIPAPIVNIPEQKIKIPTPIVNIDTKDIGKSVKEIEGGLKEILKKISEEKPDIEKVTLVDSKGKPIDFTKIKGGSDSSIWRSSGGFENVGIKNSSDTRINPATEETLQAVLAASGVSTYNYIQSDTGATYKYYGYASATGWQFKRKTLSTGVWMIADGTGDYDTAWADRANKAYAYT